MVVFIDARVRPVAAVLWFSANGNISLNQYYTVRYDIKNNVLFGGTQDTGSSAQVSGAGLIGSTQWENLKPGDGFEQEVDNISDPNITYRYQTGNFLGNDGTLRLRQDQLESEQCA